MDKKIVGLALIILFVALSIVVAYFSFVYNQSNEMPYKQPQLLCAEYFPDRHPKASQGSTFQIIMTFKSDLDSELILPLGELTLIGYNDTDRTDYLPEGELFNHNFSLNPLILPPYGSNSTTLTVTIAKDAPIGLYLFEVVYANSDITHVSGTRIRATVESANQ